MAGGIKKESLVYKWFLKISKKIYSSADVLAVTSPSFSGYIEDLTGKKIKTIYLPQYAEDIFSEISGGMPDGFSQDKINLTFTGNVGAAQSVETIVRAAALLKDHDEIVFHIVGSGSELENCKILSKNLDINNIIFHGRKPLEDMPTYHNASDAMLATFPIHPFSLTPFLVKSNPIWRLGVPYLVRLPVKQNMLLKRQNVVFAAKLRITKV